jgi:glycosyltransferase involved in cell wall biosynthesis
MNLLYLTLAYLPSTGGVQRSVRNLAAEFVRRGHQVTIVADGASSRSAGVSFRREAPATVVSLRIPTAFHWGLRHKIRSRALDGINLLGLAALCYFRRIDLVHCHLINVDTRYAMGLRKTLGIRTMITLRGGEFSQWIKDKPARREYVRRMLRSADIITALSASQLNDARELEPNLSCPTRVIPNPVDVATITRLAESSSADLPEKPYFMFSGRFESEKGLEDVIEAYLRILTRNPEFAFDLVLVGGGSLESELRAQASRGTGASRIRFWGECQYETCLRLIQRAAGLILPSRESEGCPNVLLEAMALETPVIVSDLGPLQEMIKHRVNGEVFARRDVQALQTCMERIAPDTEACRRYAAAGLEHLERRHRFDSIANAYEELYASLRH